MPISTIDEAPENLRELDGAALTVKQINHILRIFDALEEEGEVEEPMAAAIAQFKALYHKAGNRWVRNGSEAQRVRMAAMIEAVEGATGREWEVVIIGARGMEDVVEVEGQRALRTKNGEFYLLKALENSVGIWEGVKVYDNHLTDEEFVARQGMRSVANEWMGTIVDPWWQAEPPQVRGKLKIVEEGLTRKLMAAMEQGPEVLRGIGLSIDAFVTGREVKFEGQSVPLFEEIVQAFSVDVVANPAAGGGFERVLASIQDEGGSEMDEEQLRTLVQGLVAEAIGDLSNQVREQIKEAVQEALDAQVEPEESEDDEPAEEEELESEEEVEEPAEDARAEEARTMLAEAKELAARLIESAQVQRCEAALETALAGSGLPEAFRDVLRARYVGRVFEAEELEGEIKAQREALMRVSESGRVRGLGEMLRPSGDDVAPQERLVHRALATFGMRDEIPEAYRSREASPAWRGLRDMYIDLTGDDEFYGRFYAERITESNVTTTTMSYTVANVLNKILVNEFFKKEQWWEPLVTNRDLDKFQDMRLVSLYGFSTLATVQEGGPYLELTWDDYEETASIAKKGNYVGVTLEMIMKDDLQTVRKIPEGLGAAAYNTVADLVSGVFTDNSGTGPDMTATSRKLWNGTDGNLLTSALSFANFDTAAQTLMGFTEPGSSRGLGLMPGYLLVPTELYTTGLQIRNSEQEPGTGDNDVNPWYQQFDVVRVPTWTDADNWALMARPEQFEGIVLGWLFGKRQPEIFVADSELAGAMFTNDEMRIKMRFWTCLGVTDYRFGVKSNV